VLSKLDVKLRTPTPIIEGTAPWSAKTPYNQAGFTAQTELIQNRIIQHPESSPTKTTDAINQVLKGTIKLATELELVKAGACQGREHASSKGQ
jgi:hypothetical protein